MEWCGHEGIVLHSRDIRKAQGEFGFLTDKERKARFLEALNQLMTESDYKLIAVAIRKDRHVRQYRYPTDPYELALLLAMERLLSVAEAERQADVTVIAEARGKKEDRELHVAFQRIVTTGTAFVEGARFRQIRFTLRFVTKPMNVTGTQLADLAAYPIARRVLDPTKPNRAYDIIRPKLCRPLNIFP